MHRGHPPAAAGFRVTPSREYTCGALALRAFDGKTIEAELAMEDEMVPASGIGANDVEIGGGCRRAGVGRRRRSQPCQAGGWLLLIFSGKAPDENVGEFFAMGCLLDGW